MDNTFEQSYRKLEGLLQELEENKDDLDKSLEIYNEAKKVYDKLSLQLDDYKAKVEQIKKDE